ncbi:MAG: DNA methylase, partial [Oscillospiraceae bacterium]|nr:DNA methylase [Oscillospiraceae bacterium]
MDKVYIAIDLKSFYASVECADRKYDPLSTNLVVADLSRTEKTICLAVSPSLKKYGISGRARLFEVVQRVKEINQERFRKAIKLGVLPKDEKGHYHFTSSSFDAEALDSDPALELGYIVAPPRMMLYEKISTQVFSVYSKYIAPEDIHVYSIDEVFIDVTPYLATYSVTAHELAMQMIREVLYTTGITATAGIGTNMYLAKVAMDIVAKHVPADEQGVRIAELDEMSYREKLWCHTPITDFWRVGPGTARRLERLGCYTMGDVARLSVHNEGALYKAMGINAELLIDHAWGWEPTDIATIKSYRPETASLSSGQVLKEPYDYDKGRLIVREMTELLVLDLVRKVVVTKQMVMTIGYDRESLIEGPDKKTYTVKKTGKVYTGKVVADFYGRPHPSHAHGTGNIDHYTSSTNAIMDVMMEL